MLSKKEIRERLSSLMDCVENLESQDWTAFKDLKPSDLPVRGGVYVIADENEVLYVGQTTDMQRRLYTNHLMGNASTARLKKYLWEDTDKPGIEDMSDAKTYLRNHCRFRWIPEENARHRGLIEGGLRFAYNARYVDSDREGGRR